MNIGVLKERKTDEYRVALRPDQVRQLVSMGHKVFVEKDAGIGSGFEDGYYKGCAVVDRESVYENSALLLKVKCPLPGEYKYLKAHHVLFAYLHFDENISTDNIAKLIDTGVTAIAYEWVEANGRFPLLEPMSDIAGKLFAYKSMQLLMEESGILPGKHKEPTCVNAMVIGAGRLGSNAINVLHSNGFRLTIVDKNPSTLFKRLDTYTDHDTTQNKYVGSFRIISFDERYSAPAVDEIRQSLPMQHIVINAAVRRPSLPKSVCEYIVDRNSVKTMRKKSILCDATACDRDLIETAVSSERLSYFYMVEDVIHYNCDHIPSLTPKTSTFFLTEAIFPYILQLTGGFKRAVNKVPALYKGVMCYRDNLTHEYSATKKNLKYKPLSSLLNRATGVFRITA